MIEYRARVGLALSAAVLAGTMTGVVAAAPARAAGCVDVHVVAARGTNEPGGLWSQYKLGTVVGNPVYAAIDDRLSQSTNAYRVQYPAGYEQPASVQAGNRDLVDHVVARAAACPDQQFVLVGYSQGANVVDNSIGISSAGARVGGPIVATLPAELAPRIAAILLFGNPIRGVGREVTGVYADRTYDVCNDNDPVCDPRGKDWNVHMQYKRYADEAAAFVAARVRPA
ncbi:cutinase family protein [Nocardia caishijiensis]|uniref:Cutinase n=1 Tax=Nocardia caishijiensis TaxID=184756 RepID=A0ABQ6YI26_9NOCA|nr:cutinase family protein [Nocardia caishijiensis]KAF0845429.1 cutinase [Nocardia caishijiensis]